MITPNTKLPKNLYRAEQVRQLDQRAINSCAITGYELMNRAGAAAFDRMASTWPDVKSILVFCGPGNNGGDGFVLARLAHKAGYQVQVFCTVNQKELSGDAKLAANDLVNIGVKILSSKDFTINRECLVIDALFGTGLNRPVSEDIIDLIEKINNSQAPVYSIDIPSGIQADTGQKLGTSVHANATITFIGLKQGLFTAQAPEYTGDVYFSDLQVTADVYHGVDPSAVLLNEFILNDYFPKRRAADSHKGHYGHVLVIGGDYGYAGAPRMAAEAAARTGSGLVSVATRQQNTAAIIANRPELMVHEVNQGKDLGALIDKATVIVMGPGLGQSEWAQALFSTVLESNKPLVIDADALNILAAEPSKKTNWILTPHPGEAARLLGTSTAEIQNDRFTAIRKIQSRYDGTIVLKGCGSLVIDKNEKITVVNAGNPGMSTGGMGDVLSGILGGLLAQGLDMNQAACMGTMLHACAGDLAAENGERGLLATDLMPWIRHLMNFG